MLFLSIHIPNFVSHELKQPFIPLNVRFHFVKSGPFCKAHTEKPAFDLKQELLHQKIQLWQSDLNLKQK